jgi:hypothetical protein
VSLEASLRGYLLEEALAWLIRGSGYRLLVSEEQDTDELVSTGSELRVRGRGTTHQVDVLGEFVFTPAFSLPVRLFLEAKFHSRPCGLEVVRNAHGVIHDVNENFVQRAGSRRPRRRYQYGYALFSANGYTAEAQEYGLAHQISLVDLSGESFAWLLTAVRSAATALYRLQTRYQVKRFPVKWMREQLRGLLSTAPPDISTGVITEAQQFREHASAALESFASNLHRYAATELLIGFPSAPFILPLVIQNKRRFLDYGDAHPSHEVQIRRVGDGPRAEWTMRPWEAPAAYQMTFTLPEHVEHWIVDHEEWRLARARRIKADFLSDITVYHADNDVVRTFQLRYQPSQFRRP